MELTNLIGFLLGIIAIFQGGVTGSQYSLTLEGGPSVTSVGRNYSVTCHVRKYVQDNVSYIIRWTRTTNGESHILSIDNEVEEVFKASGRYTASYEMEVPQNVTSIIFSLQITNLTTAENGLISCELQGVKDIKAMIATQNVTVFSDVKKITVQTKFVKDSDMHVQTHANNATVHVDENQAVDYFCTVSGSYPSPNVVVTSGDRDLTHLFTRLERVLTTQDPPGLQQPSYHVELVVENLLVDYELSREPLVCTASIPDSPFKPQTSLVNFQLNGFTPKFLCNNVQLADLLDTDFEVTCEVRAEPPVTHTSFFFYQNGKSYNLSLDAGQNEGYYQAIEEPVTGGRGNDTRMILRIARIHLYHFRDYYFKARNDRGTTQFVVTLQRDPGYQTQGSGSGRSSFTGSLILLVLLQTLSSHIS